MGGPLKANGTKAPLLAAFRPGVGKTGGVCQRPRVTSPVWPPVFISQLADGLLGKHSLLWGYPSETLKVPRALLAHLVSQLETILPVSGNHVELAGHGLS